MDADDGQGKYECVESVLPICVNLLATNLALNLVILTSLLVL